MSYASKFIKLFLIASHYSGDRGRQTPGGSRAALFKHEFQDRLQSIIEKSCIKPASPKKNILGQKHFRAPTLFFVFHWLLTDNGKICPYQALWMWMIVVWIAQFVGSPAVEPGFITSAWTSSLGQIFKKFELQDSCINQL